MVFKNVKLFIFLIFFQEYEQKAQIAYLSCGSTYRQFGNCEALKL